VPGQNWNGGHRDRDYRLTWALTIVAVLGLILSVGNLIWHGGGESATMKQQVTDLQRQLDQKEDKGVAEAEHQGVMNMLNAIETQQARIIELETERRRR
jgi:hypothetical protein